MLMTLHFNYHWHLVDNLNEGSSALVWLAGGYDLEQRTFLEVNSMVVSW